MLGNSITDVVHFTGYNVINGWQSRNSKDQKINNIPCFNFVKEIGKQGLVEKIQSKDNKKHIEIILLDKAELIIEAGHNAQKQFAKNVLSGLTEEKQVCINIFDKICNNAEEHLRNYKENANEK